MGRALRSAAAAALLALPLLLLREAWLQPLFSLSGYALVGGALVSWRGGIRPSRYRGAIALTILAFAVPFAMWLVQLPISVWWEGRTMSQRHGVVLSDASEESAYVGLIVAVAVAAVAVSTAGFAVHGRWNFRSTALWILCDWIVLGVVCVLARPFVGTAGGWLKGWILVTWVALLAAQVGMELGADDPGSGVRRSQAGEVS